MNRIAAFCLLLCLAAAPAAAREVVDLAGRRVAVPDRVERVVLGEGRMLLALGILDPADPVRRVVGMMGEFPLLDPAGYALWRRHFPALDAIAAVGKASAASFDAEKAIALKPDVAIFALAGHGPGPGDTETVARLEAAGIAVVFVDFFKDPLRNVPASLRLLGEVMGREDRAAAFAEAYAAALAQVDDRLRGVTDRPLVFLENRVGLQEDCCASVGDTVIGGLIARAGGRNLGSGLIPGNSGLISLEYLLSRQPAFYVGTAIGNPGNRESQPARIQMGPGVTPEEARASLSRSLRRTGIADLDAVRDGRAYALWHHFFHSPFNVVAVQAMAKWFHPDRFADLDPEATLHDFKTRFQPFDDTGVYWVSAR